MIGLGAGSAGFGRYPRATPSRSTRATIMAGANELRSPLNYDDSAVELQELVIQQILSRSASRDDRVTSLSNYRARPHAVG